jgi:tRNA 2-thiocytidine biosynthesis protein TtcA
MFLPKSDRLLLGLSGGKDSLALLHTLVAIQKRAPVKINITISVCLICF